jgi:hypothetical protein
MSDLPKRLRDKDFRKAVQALAELRNLPPQSAAALVPSIDTASEQQAFQLLVARLLAESGLRGLAARWRELHSPEWRERLVSEIGQALPLWVDEGTVDVLLAALDDGSDAVGRRAVAALLACLRERSERERKAATRTLSGRTWLDASDRLAAMITPRRRAHIAATVTAALDRCAGDPNALTWPDDYIELLGLTACSTDGTALSLLEGFRARAGETRRGAFERLDPDDLPWPTSAIAERKGIPPGTPFVRIHSVPTGLLDLARLEEAIERIRKRAPATAEPS